jgi:hypothetical protein
MSPAPVLSAVSIGTSKALRILHLPDLRLCVANHPKFDIRRSPGPWDHSKFHFASRDENGLGQNSAMPRRRSATLLKVILTYYRQKPTAFNYCATVSEDGSQVIITVLDAITPVTPQAAAPQLTLGAKRIGLCQCTTAVRSVKLQLNDLGIS